MSDAREIAEGQPPRGEMVVRQATLEEATMLATPDPAILLCLAERVEAATGNGRKLFEDVFRAVFPKPQRIWITDNTGDWTPEYGAWQRKQNIFYGLTELGGFLDAAMMLVPDLGNKSWVMVQSLISGGWQAAVGLNADEAIAATPALALTAASLRAIAKGEG